MILFKNIRWKNFLSTGQNFVEVNLNPQQSTLIIGDNGAGKSTILDALSFAMYGKPFRKISKSQLLNSINNKGALVELEFVVARNNYKIVRGIKPNKFEIWQNGKMINQDAAVRDYQEMLEKQILKLNHKSFSQIVVLGSATFTPFMQLSAANRREVIEDILDIGIFSIMNNLLKERMVINKQELSDSMHQVTMIQTKIDMATEHQKQLNAMRKLEIKKLDDKIEQVKDGIEQAQQFCDQKNEVIEQLHSQTEDHASINKKIKQIEKLRMQLDDKRKSLSDDITFYENHDNCPTCKQGIDHEFKQLTIDEKKQKHDEIHDASKQLNDEYQKVNKRLEEILQIIEQISDINNQIRDKKTQIQIWERAVTGIEEERRAAMAPVESQGEDIPSLIKEKEQQVELYQQHVNQKETYSHAAQLLRDGGIKSKIIKQYIPVINKLINKYLAAMDFFVQFELDENFNETIKSRFRDSFSYSSFSEGEKMRIDLALLFTWRAVAKLRNSVSTNLLIMDEVFDSSLDAGGTEEFMKIMEQITTDVNVFVISHKGDQLFDKFESVIKFEKHQNFSRIAA